MKKQTKTVFFIIIGTILVILLSYYAEKLSYDEIKKEVEYLEETARIVVIDTCSGKINPKSALDSLESIEEEIKRNAKNVPAEEEKFIADALGSIISMKYSIERYKIDKNYGPLCVEIYSKS